MSLYFDKNVPFFRLCTQTGWGLNKNYEVETRAKTVNLIILNVFNFVM